VKHAVKSGSAVVAFGDGLISACEGTTAEFDVNSKGQRGELDVRVQGTHLKSSGVKSRQYNFRGGGDGGPTLKAPIEAWRCTLPSMKIFEMLQANLYILVLFGVVCLFFSGRREDAGGATLIPVFYWGGSDRPSPPGSRPMAHNCYLTAISRESITQPFAVTVAPPHYFMMLIIAAVVLVMPLIIVV